MKLTRGTLKVIITDGEAIVENADRARNRGKIFVPPYVIYEHTPAPDGGFGTLDKHYAFDFKTRGLTPRYSLVDFPYAWAPRALKDTRAWFETTDELTLVTNYIPQE